MEATRTKSNSSSNSNNNNNSSTSSSSGTETARNILMSKAIEAAKDAMNMDESGKNPQQALVLYERAIQMLINLAKSK